MDPPLVGILESYILPSPQLIGKWRILRAFEVGLERRIIEEIKDTILWMGTKNGMFFAKAMYRRAETKKAISFPLEMHMGELRAT